MTQAYTPIEVPWFSCLLALDPPEGGWSTTPLVVSPRLVVGRCVPLFPGLWQDGNTRRLWVLPGTFFSLVFLAGFDLSTLSHEFHVRRPLSGYYTHCGTHVYSDFGTLFTLYLLRQNRHVQTHTSPSNIQQN